MSNQIFEFSFIDELAKLASDSDKPSSNKDKTKYRPRTIIGSVADPTKHITYGGAGLAAGSLLGAGGAAIANMINRRRAANSGTDFKPTSKLKGSLLGSLLGGLAGTGISMARNRKRMARRLKSSDLDHNTFQFLRQSGVFKPKLTDLIPYYGKKKAARDIRQHLESAGKQTHGLIRSRGGSAPEVD